MSTNLSCTHGHPLRYEYIFSEPPLGYYCKECNNYEHTCVLDVVRHILSTHQDILSGLFSRMEPVFKILKTSKRSQDLISHLSSLFSVGDGITVFHSEFEELDDLQELSTLPDFVEGFEEWKKTRMFFNQNDDKLDEDFGPEEYADEILSKDPVFLTLKSLSSTSADLHNGMIAAYAFLLVDMDIERLKYPNILSLVLTTMCLGYRHPKRKSSSGNPPEPYVLSGTATVISLLRGVPLTSLIKGNTSR